MPGALLASTRSGAERAMREQVVDGDREPIAVAGGEICSVDEFPYLGSMI